MKRILLLGSTGSIGVQALDVIDADPRLVACGLACGTRGTEQAAAAAARGITATSVTAGGGTVAATPDFGDLIDASEPDLVLNALVGAAGLPPTLAALERGIPVALANKESLVAGGDVVAAIRARTGADLIPVDSEHSALFQLLEGVSREQVRSATLTASGGPFRGRSAADLANVTVADALKHPSWVMGAKITIDSATLMNKGLEVIEAHHLFGLSYDEISVVVHPQSLVHAMVTLGDGSQISHMGPPDMRIPIGHALSWPEPPLVREPFDLAGRTMAFEPPDEKTFRCLSLARAAGREGGTAPAILNAANEVAVAAFLDGRIGFLAIADTVERTLGLVHSGPAATLEDVLYADARARVVATQSLGAAS